MRPMKAVISQVQLLQTGVFSVNRSPLILSSKTRRTMKEIDLGIPQLPLVLSQSSRPEIGSTYERQWTRKMCITLIFPASLMAATSLSWLAKWSFPTVEMTTSTCLSALTNPSWSNRSPCPTTETTGSRINEQKLHHKASMKSVISSPRFREQLGYWDVKQKLIQRPIERERVG